MRTQDFSIILVYFISDECPLEILECRYQIQKVVHFEAYQGDDNQQHQNFQTNFDQLVHLQYISVSTADFLCRYRYIKRPMKMNFFNMACYTEIFSTVGLDESMKRMRQHIVQRKTVKNRRK